MVIEDCPFCGHDDVEIDEIAPARFAVTCPECQCIGPVSEVSAEGAILQWNIRQERKE
jgi:Lar family restriction alleviation protein